MKKLLAALAVSLIGMLPLQAHAADLQGTVLSETTVAGTFRALFSAASQLAPSDVFEVSRGGAVVGQAILLRQGATFVVVAAPGGSLQAGDRLVFSHHALASDAEGGLGQQQGGAPTTVEACDEDPGTDGPDVESPDPGPPSYAPTTCGTKIRVHRPSGHRPSGHRRNRR